MARNKAAKHIVRHEFYCIAYNSLHACTVRKSKKKIYTNWTSLHCEKAFKRWCGPDTTAKRRIVPIRAEWVADLRRQTCKCRHLPRAFETGCGPPRPIIRLFADSAPAYAAQITKRPLAEFWFPADLPPYSPNLNSLDFDTRHVLQAKAQATPHSNFNALRPSIAAE